MKPAFLSLALFSALSLPALGSVQVSSPANSSTVTSPVQFTATSTSTCAKGVSAIGVYVNNQQVVVQNGSALSASIPLAKGTYQTVVQEWDGCGGSTTSTANITVSGTAPSSTSGVAVTSPLNGSSVNSPVLYSAKATTTACAAGIAAIGVYVDNVLAYQTSGAILQSALKISNGSHYTVAQAWDKCGGAFKTPISISVQSAPAVTLTTSPQSISAGGSSMLKVSASNATQVVITGSNGTTYALPGSGGQQVVSPSTTTTYTATATGPTGKATSVATVTVATTGAPAVGVTASSTSIAFGTSTILTATSTNATRLAITGSDGSSYVLSPSGGTQVVTPSVTATYTATATALSGATNIAQVVITVVEAPGGSAVLMHRNDLAGDGLNQNESILTPANVNTKTFGRKFALAVDGQIYVQPLYVPGISINGAVHNTVFVATQNDSVYAFDSDSGTQLWKVSLGTPVANNDPEGVQPTLGILSTPVIDLNGRTLYVTGVTTGRVLKLHALDLLTGAEKLNGPVTINASTSGIGDGNINGVVPLSQGCYQRTALTLANGRIYLGFGHCNHGWLLAYDANTLAQTQAFNTSPNGIGGTIWMGGAAPVVDASGNLYVITADDIGSSAPAVGNYPDAIMKLSPDLKVLDFFTPSNERYLEGNDADLGSGAPILLPVNSSGHPNEVIGGGKDGRVFVVDVNSMGGYHPDPNGQNDNVQTVQTGTQQFDNIWGAPAFWSGNLYYHTEGDMLKVYSWANGLLSTTPVSTGQHVYLNHGASPSISSNGTTDAIVWDVDNSGYPSSGGSGGTPAILHAYDATNVNHELYNSSLATGSRDTAGHACKFSVPTVTDGKVFVPTCTELDIYGLLP